MVFGTLPVDRRKTLNIVLIFLIYNLLLRILSLFLMKKDNPFKKPAPKRIRKFSFKNQAIKKLSELLRRDDYLGDDAKARADAKKYITDLIKTAISDPQKREQEIALCHQAIDRYKLDIQTYCVALSHLKNQLYSLKFTGEESFPVFIYHKINSLYSVTTKQEMSLVKQTLDNKISRFIKSNIGVIIKELNHDALYTRLIQLQECLIGELNKNLGFEQLVPLATKYNETLKDFCIEQIKCYIKGQYEKYHAHLANHSSSNALEEFSGADGKQEDGNPGANLELQGSCVIRHVIDIEDHPPENNQPSMRPHVINIEDSIGYVIRNNPPEILPASPTQMYFGSMNFFASPTRPDPTPLFFNPSYT